MANYHPQRIIQIPPTNLPVLHYLRIAVTALSLTACVLLIALWVRSYWWVDSIASRVTLKFGFHCTTLEGRIVVEFDKWIELTPWERYLWRRSYPAGTFPSPRASNWVGFDFAGRRGFQSPYIIIPYWFPTLASGLLATALNLRSMRDKWRFSLRTLLIATTLVAVGLGAVTYLAR